MLVIIFCIKIFATTLIEGDNKCISKEKHQLKVIPYRDKSAVRLKFFSP